MEVRDRFLWIGVCWGELVAEGWGASAEAQAEEGFKQPSSHPCWSVVCKYSAKALAMEEEVYWVNLANHYRRTARRLPVLNLAGSFVQAQVRWCTGCFR